MNARLTKVSLLVLVMVALTIVPLVSAQGNPVRTSLSPFEWQSNIQHYAPAALTAEERQAVLDYNGLAAPLALEAGEAPLAADSPILVRPGLAAEPWQAALESAASAAVLPSFERQADIQHYAPAALSLEERKAIFQDPGFVPVFTESAAAVIDPALLSLEERKAMFQDPGFVPVFTERETAVLSPTELTPREQQIFGQYLAAAAITAQERQADIQHYAPAALTPEERDAILGHFGPDVSGSLPPRRR